MRRAPGKSSGGECGLGRFRRGLRGAVALVALGWAVAGGARAEPAAPGDVGHAQGDVPAKGDVNAKGEANAQGEVKTKGEPKTKAKGGKGAACARDADCVLVPVNCCGCNEGGKQRAIPARDKAAQETRRAQHCAGTACAEMISTDATCARVALCVEHRCALGDAAKLPPPPSAKP